MIILDDGQKTTADKKEQTADVVFVFLRPSVQQQQEEEGGRGLLSSYI
jgi:hypothetical protein